jgi:hypothetical protein
MTTISLWFKPTMVTSNQLVLHTVRICRRHGKATLVEAEVRLTLSLSLSLSVRKEANRTQSESHSNRSFCLQAI